MVQQCPPSFKKMYVSDLCRFGKNYKNTINPLILFSRHMNPEEKNNMINGGRTQLEETRVEIQWRETQQTIYQ